MLLPRRHWFTLLGLLAMLACGKTAGTNAITDGDGGRGSGLDGGAVAGSSNGAGGTGGTFGGSGEGGTRAGGGNVSPSGGRSGGSNGTAWGGEGAIEELDPHAGERRKRATEYCDLLEQYPCLAYSSFTPAETRTQMLELCRLEIEVVAGDYDQRCWDEWVAVIDCGATAPYTCPCSGVDCLLRAPGGLPGPGGDACTRENDALTTCVVVGTNGTVTGSTGECFYSVSPEQGCFVNCDRDVGGFQATCDGPAGGAQSCICELNGTALCDEALTDGVCYPWHADDCLSVAQGMADGQCQDITQCCFTWSGGGVDRCSCTADPTAAGFTSCAAAALAGGGEVVELCPRYEPVDWDFPTP